MQLSRWIVARSERSLASLTPYEVDWSMSPFQSSGSGFAAQRGSGSGFGNFRVREVSGRRVRCRAVAAEVDVASGMIARQEDFWVHDSCRTAMLTKVDGSSRKQRCLLGIKRRKNNCLVASCVTCGRGTCPGESFQVPSAMLKLTLLMM